MLCGWKAMAAYHRVHGPGHVWADQPGPQSAPQPCACIENRITFTYNDLFYKIIHNVQNNTYNRIP